jgi:hypothetical protein
MRKRRAPQLGSNNKNLAELPISQSPCEIWADDPAAG